MANCVIYVVFCLLVLQTLVEWIFQHVQTEKQKKKKKEKKKRKSQPTEAKFLSMLCQVFHLGLSGG